MDQQDKNSKDNAKAAPSGGGKANRNERLKQSLRENLRRRKTKDRAVRNAKPDQRS